MTNDDDEFANMEGAVADAVPDAMKALINSAKECSSIDAFIAQTEETLSVAKATLHEIRTQKMPALMMMLQTTEFTHAGTKFSLKDFVNGSLPKEPDLRQKAFDLLIDYDGAGLITTDINIPFGRSKHNEALELYDILKNQGYTVSIETTVHASSLKSFVRKRIEEGEPIDADTLGVFVGKTVDFKPVVEKKAKRKKGEDDEG